MSEYIVEVNGVIPDAIYERQREEIVRCRDCELYMDYEHEWEPNLGYCMQLDMNEVRGDCFCAWGERKVVD